MELSTPPGYLDNETVLQNISDELTDQDILINTGLSDWARNLIRVYVCLVAVIGIGGNVLLTIVLGTRKKRSSTDILVLALAVCDIISLVLSGPYSFLRYSKDTWENISTEWFCKLYYYTQYIMTNTSLLLVAAIAIDRYLKVFRPHIPERKLMLPIKLSCLGIYCGSTLLGIPIVFGVSRNNVGRCTTDFFSPQLPVTMAIMFVTAFLSAVSMIIIMLVYIKIGVFLRKRAKVGIKPGKSGHDNNLTLSPLPGPSSQPNQNADRQTAVTKANKDDVIELKTLGVLKPELNTKDVPKSNTVPKATNVNKPGQTETRTSVIMMALTIVHFLTRVLPALI